MSIFSNTQSGEFLLVMTLISSGALVTLIKASTSLIRFYIDKKPFSNTKMLKFLQDSIDIQEYLFDIIKEGADNAIIFAAHNGGGIPQLGKAFYTSAIYKDWNRNEITEIPSYENISIDADYIKYLLEIMRSENCVINVDDMSECQLKHHLKHLGITQTVMYNIGMVDKQYFYISVGKKNKNFEQQQLTGIELIINNIKNIIITN